MKKKYIYYFPGHEDKPVTIPKTSWIKKICCDHEMVPLVRRIEGSVFRPINGDHIQYVCKKCGTLGETDFFEFEGMGYK